MRIREAVRAIVVRGDEVLLIRHSDDVNWNLPGGGIEPGETTEQTVARELAEELSFSEEDYELLHVGLTCQFRCDPPVNGWDGQNNLLVVVSLSEDVNVVVDGDEVAEYCFGSLDLMVYEDLRDVARKTLEQARDLKLL